MKTIQFSLFLMAGALLSCQQASQESTQDTTLSLPLTYVEGFGPAGFGFGVLSGEHKKEDPAGRMWVKTYLPVRGIPASWRGVKKSMVWLDSRQLVYQNYKAGNISEEEFRGLQKGWEWELNPEEFSAEPIKCYVYVVTGRDREGLLAAVIDANNNLDVSDDDVFYPKTSAMDSSLAIYTDEEKHYVDYEVFQEGKVVSRRIPMVIKRTSVAPFLYAFPQHAGSIRARSIRSW